MPSTFLSFFFYIGSLSPQHNTGEDSEEGATRPPKFSPTENTPTGVSDEKMSEFPLLREECDPKKFFFGCRFRKKFKNFVDLMAD